MAKKYTKAIPFSNDDLQSYGADRATEKYIKDLQALTEGKDDQGPFTLTINLENWELFQKILFQALARIEQFEKIKTNIEFFQKAQEELFYGKAKQSRQTALKLMGFDITGKGTRHNNKEIMNLYKQLMRGDGPTSMIAVSGDLKGKKITLKDRDIQRGFDARTKKGRPRKKAPPLGKWGGQPSPHKIRQNILKFIKEVYGFHSVEAAKKKIESLSKIAK